MRRTRLVGPWLLAIALVGCDASCGRQDRKAVGAALGAHDCPPDVAVCIGGEAFLSVGATQGQGDPCRQLSLGQCETHCVDEGVAVSYVGKTHEEVRGQLCTPPRGTTLGVPIAAPAGCTPGDVVCKDGIVQICGKQAARCERGCATDDVITDELELTLEQATQLLCSR